VRDKSPWRAYADLTHVECDPPHDIVSLRALEASSAAAYFRAWRDIPLHWKGTNQRPLPESWRRIGSRTSLFQLAGNRNAAHPKSLASAGNARSADSICERGKQREAD